MIRPRRSAALAVTLLMLLGACESSTEPATTVASPTTTAAPVETSVAPTTTLPALDLVAYTDSLYGMRTMVPPGWEEDRTRAMIGNLVPPDAVDDSTVLAIQFAPGVTEGATVVLLGSALAPAEPLAPAGDLETADFAWSLFTTTSEAELFGGGVTAVDVALAETEGGVYLVVLAAPEGTSAELRDTVFLPAVEALTPPDRPAVEADALYLDAAAPAEERIEDLLGRMTLLEKIGQMTLVEKDSILPADLAPLGIGALLSGGGGAPSPNTPEAWADMIDGFQDEALGSRLRIPLLYGADAIHGHNNVKGAVIFPHNVGLGAVGDPELVERIGRLTAIEAAATGVLWNYAPVVAVPQDIRWGRTYEAYGEDTAMVTELGIAFLDGLQGEDLTNPVSVLATPKHYVGDGATAWGSSPAEGYAIDQGEARIDEATLRAVHLPPYEAAVEAGALSMMASFSSWDGLEMHAQRYLLTDVLKGELGFDGFVVSDWAGVDQISDDYPTAVAAAINAGIDMNMVPSRYRQFIWTLAHAVEAGEVPQERIDDAVRRILRVKFAMGLFEDPLPRRDLLDVVGSQEHRAVAAEAVSRSLVLLKNEAVFPISDDVAEIFVGGRAADDIGIQSGGWTIEWQGGTGEITEGTTILDGLVGGAPEATRVYHDRFGRLDRVTGEGETLDPDLCVAVVGERPYAEGMGDEFEPEIPRDDRAVLENMAQTCGRLAVVLVSGRPLLIAEDLDGWDALVAAWLPGSEGDGVARVLFGDEPFTGRLPYTWPTTAEQLPLGTAAPDEVLFPFGFGLTTASDDDGGGAP